MSADHDTTPPEHPVARLGFDDARSSLCPGLLLALAKAQGEISTVGKGGAVKDRDGRKAYSYAKADDMVAMARATLARHGLSLVVTTRAFPPPNFDLGERQGVSDTIVMEFRLGWSDGQAMGWLCGFAETYAVTNAQRTPDKAGKAAETYLLGFVCRNLLMINRDEISDDEDVDQRTSDPSAAAARRGQSSSSDPMAPTRKTVIDWCRRQAGAGAQPGKVWAEICADAGVSARNAMSANDDDLRALVEAIKRRAP